MQINFKWKNFFLFAIIFFFLIIFFALGGINVFGKGMLDTKHNMVSVYFVFVLFLFILSTIVFLWEKRDFGITFFKAILIFFIICLFYALISLGFYAVIYNLRLEEKPFAAKIIVFFIIEAILLLILYAYLTSKYVYFVYSVSMKENLVNEFANKNAWTLIFKNLKLKAIDNFLYLSNSKNTFILEFLANSKEPIIIQFEGEEKITQPKDIETFDNHDLFGSMEKNDEKESKEKEIIKKIAPNDFAQKILNLYEKNINEKRNIFVMTVFEEFSNVKVQGNIPEWYYWNNRDIVMKYVNKLIKVNKK